MFKLLLTFPLLTTTQVNLPCDIENSQFIAAVIRTDESIEVLINTRKYWIEKGALTDSYSPEESKALEEITCAISLCGVAESIYEDCNGKRNEEQLRTELQASCVEVNKSFQTWAQEETSQGLLNPLSAGPGTALRISKE